MVPKTIITAKKAKFTAVYDLDRLVTIKKKDKRIMNTDTYKVSVLFNLRFE